MRAIWWKETRENFRWALLALLVLTLAEFYALSSARENFQVDNGALTLCDSTFLLVTSFGCAAVGAFLGTMQILPELKRDRWAALLHRPVSPSTIFFGKVSAGLLLYLLATAVPFLACTGYVAVPGVFPAPFVPGLMLPGLNDLALGIAFYFAALLVCLERGRWFGSRGALLLAVATVFLLHLNSFGSLQPLLPAGAAVVLMLAAWGAMLGDGPLNERPWWGRAALVGAILFGTLGGFGLLSDGLAAIPWGKDAPRGTYTQFEVTRDGQVLRSTTRWDNSGTVVTDMNGKTVTDERYVGNQSYSNFCPFTPLGFSFRYPTAGFYPVRGIGSQRNAIRYVQVAKQNSMDKEHWYLLVAKNYFVGYDALSRRCVGICDREGFKPPGAKPAPFGGTLHGNLWSRTQPTLFWTDSQLYAFAFSERRLIPLCQWKSDIIEEALQLPNEFSAEELRYVLLALGAEMKLVDGQGGLVAGFSYPHDPWKWDDIEIATNPAIDRLYLQSSTSWYELGAKHEPAPSFLDELDLHGHLLHTYEHPGANWSRVPPGWPTVLLTYAMPPVPMLFREFYLGVFVPSTPDGYTASQNFALLPATRWEAFFAVATVCGALAFFWGGKVGFSREMVQRWTIFVFVFGPAGLLTFRLASDWPIRVKCPHCSCQRPVTTETCPCCNEAWGVLQMRGTEILESETVEV